MHEAKLKAFEDYAYRVKALDGRFKPHVMQVPPAKAVFVDGCKRLFLRWGRQTGKSQLIAYLASRWALLYPGSTIFILTPTSLQGRAIYAHSGVIEGIIPPEYLKDYNKTDARWTLDNGSAIRLFGVENAQALRGLTADLVLIDEAKDVAREVIDAVVMPILLVRAGTLVISGTPPGQLSGQGAYYWELVNTAETSPDWRSFRATSYDNPYTPPGAVEAERKLHEARGTMDVFKREYLAEYCPDSQSSIFPMLDKDRHVRPYEALKAQIYKNLGHWRLYVTCDPGSTFAILIVAMNEYSKQVIVLDEVYSKSQEQNSVSLIVPRVLAKLKEFAPQRFLDDPPVWVVDEAETWFRNELLDRFDISSWRSEKAHNKKTEGLALTKDLLNHEKFVMSDRCTGLLQEMQGYILGPNGLPVKRDDHAIDAFRYFLGASRYTAQEEREPPAIAELPPGMRDDPKRWFSPADDFKEHPLTINSRLEEELLLEDDF